MLARCMVRCGRVLGCSVFWEVHGAHAVRGFPLVRLVHQRGTHITLELCELLLWSQPPSYGFVCPSLSQMLRMKRFLRHTATAAPQSYHHKELLSQRYGQIPPVKPALKPADTIRQ